MSALAIFSAHLDGDIIIQDSEIIAPLLREWRDKYIGHTPFVLMPRNSLEVQKIVQIANENNIKLTLQGGNTGLVGGQIPMGEILLSLKKMNKIIETQIDDDCMIVEAGAILENVQNIAQENGRYFPLSLASQGSATIGGLISTNAGGVHVRKYGMMRNLVMGIEVVLPNGEIYQELSPLRKDNTGYDLKQFFIGAEGTLGIITKACIKLCAAPKYQRIAMIGCQNVQDLIEILHYTEANCEFLSAFEMINQNALQFGLKNLPNARNPLSKIYPYLALLEFSAISIDPIETIEKLLGDLIENGKILDGIISQSQGQIQQFWALREGMSAAQKPEGRAAKHDISVPISKIPDFFEKAQIAANNILNNVRIIAFGHISDGNIHYDVARPIDMIDDEYQKYVPTINKAVHDVVMALGGSISAEHGIGIARLNEFISREPKAHINAMRAIKCAFDPNNTLNPRVLNSSNQ